MVHQKYAGSMTCTKGEGQDIFGAPVAALSTDRSLVVPVPMLDQECRKMHTDLVQEAYPPFASKANIEHVMSFWAPIPAFDSSFGTSDPHTLTTLISCAFDDPHHVQLAYQVYSAFAECFNRLQEENTDEDDGNRLRATCLYHSVALVICVHLPPDGEPMGCSTMRNVREAAQRTNLDRLAQCPIRQQMISARQQLPSHFPFYLCDQGQGIVHAYQYKLF